MRIFFPKNFKFILALLVIISVSISTSCNKDGWSKLDEDKGKSESPKDQDDDSETQDDDSETQDNEQGNIYDLFLEKSSDSTNYININSKKLVKEQDHWDFKMSKIYASSINANTSLNGRLNFIDIEFDNVTAENILEKFGSTKNDFNKNFKNLRYFGMHKFIGDNEGWAIYHMQPNHLVIPLPDRTLLLITADRTDNNKHKLFKIKITSIYKGNILKPTPEDTLKVPFLNAKFEKININIDDFISY